MFVNTFISNRCFMAILIVESNVRLKFLIAVSIQYENVTSPLMENCGFFWKFHSITPL